MGLMGAKTPKETIQELSSRLARDDDSVFDDLVADDLVNHAAGPQGREGLRQIRSIIDHDLGPDVRLEGHHLIADGEYVAQHVTLHGDHRASTMPLLTGTAPTGTRVSWTFVHIWRVVDGLIVEHWACRDDVGLLHQIGAWPPSESADA
jgi:predicted ester cyclase